MRHFKRTVLMGFLLASASATALADSVVMRNGDRLTGNVCRLEAGVLTLKTTYAGTLSIQWKDITSLQTEKAVRHLRSGGTGQRLPTEENNAPVLHTAKIDATSPRQLAAIVSINPDPPPPPVTYTGRINLGASFADGNTQTRSLTSEGELAARGRQNRLTVGWLVKQEEAEGEKTTDSTSGFGKYDHFMSEKWYAFANMAAERDTFKDIDLRTNMGVGTGYQFFETKIKKLFAEAGVSHVLTRYDEEDDDTYMAGTWAVNAAYLLGETGVELFHRHNGLFSMEAADDIGIRSMTGFRMPLYKQVQSTFQVKWDWESSPAEGQRNSDVDYMITLGYKF